MKVIAVTVFLLILPGFGFLAGPPEGTFAASSAAFPLGTYAVEVTRADMPAAMPPLVVALQLGVWEATFAEGGRHTLSKDRQIAWQDRILSEAGQVALEGQYAATQNQIAFYNDKGPLGCDIRERDTRPFFPPGLPARARSGVYDWGFDGKTLTFVKVADDCPGRAAVFPAHPWTKRK